VAKTTKIFGVSAIYFTSSVLEGAVKIPSPYKDYPPRWGTYCEFIGVAGPKPLGFVGTIADMNRFGARYRAAKCFRRVEFEGVTVDTADGYSALCQILLSYSAFEHLLKCIGHHKSDTQSLLTRDQRDQVQSNLRSLIGQRELFIVVHEFVNQPHKVEIEKHIAGQRCNPFFLASAIRHSFAHGVLAATPVRAPQRSVATVSRFLTRVLMKVMENEFESRMIEFEKGLEH
jgi:hypothetical protein